MVIRHGFLRIVLCGLLPPLLPVSPAAGQHNPRRHFVCSFDSLDACVRNNSGFDRVERWARPALDSMHRALRAASRDSMYSSHPEPCESVKSGGVGFMAGSILTNQQEFRPGSVDFYVYTGFISNPLGADAGLYFKVGSDTTAESVYAHVIVINQRAGAWWSNTTRFGTMLHEVAHYAGFGDDPRDGVPLTAYDAESCFKRDKQEEERLRRKDQSRGGGGGIPFGWWVGTFGGGYGNTGDGLSCRLTTGNAKSCRKAYIEKNPPFPAGHVAYKNGIFWNGTWYRWNDEELVFEATICHNHSVLVKICTQA